MLKRARFCAFLIGLSFCAAQETDSTAQLFIHHCGVCHAAGATGTDRGPALTGNRRLRSRTTADIVNIILHGTPGGMPGMNLAADQASALAAYVRSFNADAFETPTPDDPAAGVKKLTWSTGLDASSRPIVAPRRDPLGDPSDRACGTTL